jgi:hypothetical protein
MLCCSKIEIHLPLSIALQDEAPRISALGYEMGNAFGNPTTETSRVSV